MRRVYTEDSSSRRGGKAFQNGPMLVFNGVRVGRGVFRSRLAGSRADIPLGFGTLAELVAVGKQPDGSRFDGWRGLRPARHRDRFAVHGDANDKRLMRNARKRERKAA